MAEPFNGQSMRFATEPSEIKLAILQGAVQTLSSSIRQRVRGFGGNGHAAGDTFESKNHGKVEGLLPVRLAPRMADMLPLCSIQGIIVSS